MDIIFKFYYFFFGGGGGITLQGPHQVAKKSTTLTPFSIAFLNSSLEVTGLTILGIVAVNARVLCVVMICFGI